jgi:Co/Zn/Cd efflux system component
VSCEGRVFWQIVLGDVVGFVFVIAAFALLVGWLWMALRWPIVGGLIGFGVIAWAYYVGAARQAREECREVRERELKK